MITKELGGYMRFYELTIPFMSHIIKNTIKYEDNMYMNLKNNKI